MRETQGEGACEIDERRKRVELDLDQQRSDDGQHQWGAENVLQKKRIDSDVP